VAGVVGDTMTAVAGDAMMATTWWLRSFQFFYFLLTNVCRVSLLAHGKSFRSAQLLTLDKVPFTESLVPKCSSPVQH
jgi:hypothetical protein